MTCDTCWHVEPARRDIGGDEEVGSLRTEALHHPVALILRQPAVQRLGAHAAAVEHLRQLVHLRARAAEHDRGDGALDVEDAPERRLLVRARHDVRHLPYLRGIARGHHLALDADVHRIAQVRRGDRGDARRQRGREERRLSLRRRGGEDRLEILGESHVEHLVGFVEHQHSHALEPQRLAADVIERSTGRGHHHVDAALERAKLRAPSTRRRRSGAPARRGRVHSGARPRLPASPARAWERG